MKTIVHKISPHGHCASICAFNGGTLLTYYNGPECTNQQAVNLEYWRDDKLIDHKRLLNKTGNPVLIPMNQQKACLIFSYFHDTDGKNRPVNPVQRWMFCSNWKTIVSLKDNKLQFLPIDQFETDTFTGYLVRCAPIQINKTWLLPVYREHNCYGQIFASSDGYKWSPRGRIGDNINQQSGRFGSGVLIQPTIWYDAKLKSLSRDVTNKMRAWYSESEDMGWTWSQPIQTDIWNDNNSVVVVHKANTVRPHIIWNNGPGRGTLMLGALEGLKAIPLLQLNVLDGEVQRAAYPNYCFDDKKRLHIVFTFDGYIMETIFEMVSLVSLEI